MYEWGECVCVCVSVSVTWHIIDGNLSRSFCKPSAGHVTKLEGVCHIGDICFYSSVLWDSCFLCFLVDIWEQLEHLVEEIIGSVSNQNHFYCHITTAQVPWWVKFLRACSKQCKKTKQFTYRQYIFTDCTEDNVQNTHTHTQYTQCTIKTVLVTNTLCTHFTLCTHLNIVIC